MNSRFRCRGAFRRRLACFLHLAAFAGGAFVRAQVAKNRMNKFYNPALYKKPVRRELTEEVRGVCVFV